MIVYSFSTSSTALLMLPLLVLNKGLKQALFCIFGKPKNQRFQIQTDIFPPISRSMAPKSDSAEGTSLSLSLKPFRFNFLFSKSRLIDCSSFSHFVKLFCFFGCSNRAQLREWGKAFFSLLLIVSFSGFKTVTHLLNCIMCFNNSAGNTLYYYGIGTHISKIQYHTWMR